MRSSNNSTILYQIQKGLQMKKFKATLYFTDDRIFTGEIEAEHIYKACQQVEIVKEHLLGLRRYEVEEIGETENEPARLV